MNLSKYFIMGSQNSSAQPEAILEEAAKAGITAFQFREKGDGALTSGAKLALGHKLRDVCARYGVLFFVNDDHDLVEPLAADGVHVGQEDMQLNKLRAMYPDKILGLSVSKQSEVDNSAVHLADYLGAGPVFPTSSKEDAKQAVGTAWIQSLKQMYPSIPVVGIGGITTANAHTVTNAGADGVAVISAITKAHDIDAAVRHL